MLEYHKANHFAKAMEKPKGTTPWQSPCHNCWL